MQNIRAYEAEQATVEELRRLSALRADFVSLVSHELRSPMAAVIGSAKTLRVRWRELTPEQRESFLALIDHETNRLAELVGDVLDTSRIESGTFSYSFSDVDIGELVRESAAAAESSQDEVAVRADVTAPLPTLRGDRERLRQVITNLIDNAVKYSPAGAEVDVEAFADQRADHGRGARPRARHPERAPVAHLREVRPRERRARQAGDRARPLHRPLDRAGPRRHARGALGRGQGATFTLALPVD